MASQTLLSDGNKWFSYSGEVIGDASVPAGITLNLIPNTGLRDSYVVIQYCTGFPVATNTEQLGIEVRINDVTVINAQNDLREREIMPETFNLFVPRQSKLEVISLNTSGNNGQKRSCNLLGYYL